jgi:ABC-type sugar transport system substrate-binding protein
VDTDATIAMSNAAADAGIPLVYVNREPVNLDDLPENQAFVASDERESGTLETREICRILTEQGKGEGAKAVIMMGELSNQAARMRTQDIHDVIATEECSFIDIVESQTAMWSRTQGADLMTNWLSAGIEFDAVISNNDEMAIGAIQALKTAGVPMDEVVVGGIDATQDALAAMEAGDLDVTVFQNAAGQGQGAVDAALKLARGEEVAQKNYVPFELVTPANIADYQATN